MFYTNARIFTSDFQFHTGAFEVKDGKATWALSEQSNPQLSYKLTCCNNGEVLAESYVTRPEVREAEAVSAASYTLTITDIFGNTATATL